MNATDTAVMELANNTIGAWMSGLFGFIYWFAMFACAIFIFSVIWNMTKQLARGGGNIVMGKGNPYGTELRTAYARNRSIRKWHDGIMKNAAKYGYKSRY